MEKLLLRVNEAAELASVGRTTAYQLINAGENGPLYVSARLYVFP